MLPDFEVKQMDIVEKRRKFLINLFYFSIFVTLYYLFVKFAFWVVAPFVISFLIAMLLQKPIGALSSKTRINKKILSVVFVFLIIVVLIGLLVLIGYLVGNEFYNFGKYLMGKLSSLPAVIESAESHIIGVASRLPGKLGVSLSDAVKGIADNLLGFVREEEAEAGAVTSSAAGSFSGFGLSSFDFSSLSTPLAGILSTAKRIPAVLTAILIGIISCFFMTSDYDGFISKIKGMMSESSIKKVSKTKHVVFDILGKWCKSYAALLFITFCEMTVGLHILKFTGLYNGGYIFVIAICTALLDILPVFGTGTVLIPWGIISLFTHKIGLGVGLLVIYGAITVIRQVLEPRIVSANVDIHPVITLMSMYIGIQIFGVFGILILPITVVVIKTLNDEGIIHLWGNGKAGAESEGGKKGEISSADLTKSADKAVSSSKAETPAK